MREVLCPPHDRVDGYLGAPRCSYTKSLNHGFLQRLDDSATKTRTDRPAHDVSPLLLPVGNPHAEFSIWGYDLLSMVSDGYDPRTVEAWIFGIRFPGSDRSRNMGLLGGRKGTVAIGNSAFGLDNQKKGLRNIA